MASTYFQPEVNKLYGIGNFVSQNNKWYALTAGDDNSVTFEDTGVQAPDAPDFSTFPANQLWQFFKITGNSYIIANYATGQVLNFNEDYSNIEVGSLSEHTPLVEPIYSPYSRPDFPWPNQEQQPSLFMNNQACCAWLYPTIDTTVTPNEVVIKLGAQAGWFLYIEPARDIDVNILVEETVAFDYPTFVDNIAPPVYPAVPALINTFNIPYFFVNDPSIRNAQEQIENSPYYILRQFGQYQLTTGLNNPSVDTVTLVEEWQYGWSDSTSDSFSDTIGATLGGSIEGNEIFVKETLSSELNAQLGISQTKTSEQSESQMTQIRIEVPPNTNMALYGLTTKFEVYQSEGICPIATPPTPMGMKNNFTIISDEEAS